MHPIVGGSNTVSSYINNYIETVTGHTGSSTRALRMNITGPAPGFCCIQSTFQVAGMTQPVTDFYTRFWVKLNPELLSQVQANGGNFWRTLLELKTTTDYRIATFIVGNSSGIPSWRVIVDNNPNGTLPPCPAGACWSADNTSVSVPANQWFLMEYYLHRSTGSNGRFFWAVNGQTLVDHYGPTYGANQENINFLALLNLYGDGNNMSPAYQWIDDVEVWDVPALRHASLRRGSGTTRRYPSPDDTRESGRVGGLLQPNQPVVEREHRQRRGRRLQDLPQWRNHADCQHRRDYLPGLGPDRLHFLQLYCCRL